MRGHDEMSLAPVAERNGKGEDDFECHGIWIFYSYDHVYVVLIIELICVLNMLNLKCTPEFVDSLNNFGQLLIH